MSKKKTVYIIGAGFNQCIKNDYGIAPPLSKNFFKNMFKSEVFRNKEYQDKINILLEYIEKYWKISKDELVDKNFNLEDCFTLLQLQIFDAVEGKRNDELFRLLEINSFLKRIFLHTLSDFEMCLGKCSLLKKFASYIYKEKPTMITLNYDCNLEKIIENISGEDKWNRWLCYGVEFDKLMLKDKVFDKEEFFKDKKNKLYKWEILKLHGSFNWFKCIPVNNRKNTKAFNIIAEKDNNFSHIINSNDFIIDPLIIPPVLYKNYGQELISEIWNKAKNRLSDCKRLIIIGYSLPVTDFYIKKLFLESFECNELEELIIVNPDNTVISKVKELVHYKKPIVVCSNLKEFMDYCISS